MKIFTQPQLIFTQSFKTPLPKPFFFAVSLYFACNLISKGLSFLYMHPLGKKGGKDIKEFIHRANTIAEIYDTFEHEINIIAKDYKDVLPYLTDKRYSPDFCGRYLLLHAKDKTPAFNVLQVVIGVQKLSAWLGLGNIRSQAKLRSFITNNISIIRSYDETNLPLNASMFFINCFLSYVALKENMLYEEFVDKKINKDVFGIRMLIETGNSIEQPKELNLSSTEGININVVNHKEIYKEVIKDISDNIKNGETITEDINDTALQE